MESSIIDITDSIDGNKETTFEEFLIKKHHPQIPDNYALDFSEAKQFLSLFLVLNL